MSFETLMDGARVAVNYVALGAFYYAFIAYPIIWFRRRRAR